MKPVHFTGIKVAILAVVLVISMLSCALIYVHAGNSGAAGKTAAVSGQEKVVGVVRGDTLWQIAKDHLPQDESINYYIYKIKKRNGLNHSNLQEGQLLVLP